MAAGVGALALLCGTTGLVTAGLASPASASTPLHGLGVSKGCDSPTNIGAAYTCTYGLSNDPFVDPANDTIKVSDLTDVIENGAAVQPSESVLSHLTVASTTGTATCFTASDPVNGCTLPPSSTVTFNPFSFYTVQASDFVIPATPGVLPDQVTATWTATCEAGVTNCPVGPQHDQSSSSSEITKNASNVVTSVQQGGVTVTSIPLGTSATDHAVVSPGAGSSSSATPTGTVTFEFFGNGTCTGTPRTTQSNVSLVNGAADSASTGALTVSGADNKDGNYGFLVSYSGDGTYLPQTGTCEPFTVQQANTVTLTSVQQGGVTVTSIPLGTAVDDVATVQGTGAGTPTGSVTFNFFNNGSCTGTAVTTQPNVALDVNGMATSNMTANLTVSGSTSGGSYGFRVTYNGDTNYNASTGSCEPFTVGPGPSVTTTNIQPAGTTQTVSTVPVGTSVQDSVTVSGTGAGTPTGTVDITFYTNSTCADTGTTQAGVTLVNGMATSNATGPLTLAGEPNSSTDGLGYSFKAHYNGSADYKPSDGSCEPLLLTQIPSATVTQIQQGGATVTSVSAGSTVTDQATVTANPVVPGVPAPTGTVTFSFFKNGTCANTAFAVETDPLSGGVANSVNPQIPGGLTVGMYSYSATYNGDKNYTGSPGQCEPLQVTPLTPTVVTTPTPGAGGFLAPATVTDDVTVSGPAGDPTPTGTVSILFFTNGTCTGTTFTDAGSPTLVNGAASSTTESGLEPGSYGFLVTYNGDGFYAASTAACEPFQVIQRHSQVVTTVTSGGNPVTAPLTAPASVTDTGTVSSNPAGGPTPTGSVSIQFYTGTAANPCATASGAAVSATLDASGNFSGDPQTGLTAGSYGYIVTYNGDTTYASSVGTCEPFSVVQRPSHTDTTVMSGGVAVTGALTPGSTVTDTATVTGSFGTPTGTVTFTFFTNGTCTAPGTVQTPPATLVNGMATSAPEGPLASGSYSFQATYNGNDTYLPSTSGCEPFTVSSPFTANLTPGFWKNHEDATSDLLPQTLGTFKVTTFTEAQAILEGMGCGSRGALNCMAGMLLAADLNLAQGGNTCIKPTIAQANALLIKYAYKGPGTYTLSASDQQLAMDLHDTLSAYNIDGIPTC